MAEQFLKGRVAVVTGASRGIGEAIAVRYAMAGARVVVSARTEKEGDHALPGSVNETAERIRSIGGEALAVVANLADAEDRERMIAQAEAAFGPVDILVNNAAVTYFFSVEDFTDKRFDLMMEVQVRAPFHLAQLVLPGMKARGCGWILNVSSHAAIHPKLEAPNINSTVYGMCKAALERFSTGLAHEVYAQGICVNVISPGLIATPGAVHHHLIDASNEDMVIPVEHMSEACLRLVHSIPEPVTGRIAYAAKMLSEFDLVPAAFAAV